MLGAESPEEIIFTSGGTESDNAAVVGVAEALTGRGRHVVTSASEHPAVERACAYLEGRGWSVTRVDVDADGRADVAAELPPGIEAGAPAPATDVDLRLMVVESLDVEQPKTKLLVQQLGEYGVDSALIISTEVGENLYLAARNLHKVDVRDVDGVDPVSLIAYDKVVVTVDAVKKFEEMLG